jgi:hypothetical protein
MANYYGGVSTQTTPINVNGIEYGWSSITVLIAGLPIAGITSLNYTASQESVNVYGRGSKPVARGVGNYTYEGDLTIHKSELESLMRAIQALGYDDVLETPLFDIQVIYQRVGSASFSVDVIKNAQFTSVPMALSQGGAAIEVNLTFLPSNIIFSEI